MSSPQAAKAATATAPAAEPDLDLYRLQHGAGHPQADFYGSSAPYVYLKAGRGCGKTLVLVFDAVAYAEQWPGSTQLLTEPSWPMIERVALPALTSLYGRLRGHGIAWNESPPIDIRLRNGSSIWLAATDSIDADRLRGMNLARLLMDEAAIGRQEAAFHLASGSVRDTERPTQRKFTSTPQGRNWLWRMFTSGERLPGSETYVAYSRDAEAAGFVPPGWVEDRALEYGGWDAPLARQELLAQELEMAGQVHPQFSREAHVRTLVDGWRSLKLRFGGIDFGGVSPTALVCGGMDGTGRMWAYDEWYRHEATLDDVVMAMADFRDRAGVFTWLADPSGKAQIEKLRHAGFEVRPARHGNDLKLRVQLVGARLNTLPTSKEPGCYFTPEVPHLIAETEGLVWRRQRLQGQTEEMLTDAFERSAPDHAWDAWANIVAECDLTRQPFRRGETRKWAEAV